MKTVLITGGVNGLGREIAEQFLSNDYRVFVTSRTHVKSIPRLELIPLDLSSYYSVKDFIAVADGIIDSIDVFVSNAGILIPESISDISIASVDQMLTVNLSSPLMLTQWVSKKMNNDGHILFVSSIASVVSKPTSVVYSTVKAGLTGMVKSLAIDLAKRNIMVNSISPGPIKSDMVDRLVPEVDQVSIIESIPLRRLARPDEVARFSYFLCSDENTYLTGQNIIIDGGFTCR